MELIPKEILGEILSYLSPTDLIILKRVSKTFQALVSYFRGIEVNEFTLKWSQKIVLHNATFNIIRDVPDESLMFLYSKAIQYPFPSVVIADVRDHREKTAAQLKKIKQVVESKVITTMSLFKARKIILTKYKADNRRIWIVNNFGEYQKLSFSVFALSYRCCLVTGGYLEYFVAQRHRSSFWLTNMHGQPPDEIKKVFDFMFHALFPLFLT
jgi:F-box domain